MKYFLGILLFLVFSVEGSCQISLPKLVSDGMVLQRDAEVTIWGWASPGEKIQISFQGQEMGTVTTEEGDWKFQFKNLKPGGPFTMNLDGENSIELKEVYVGDVWICSGQSNMETTMSRVSPLYPDEIDSANNPEIRYFEVPKEYDLTGERTMLSGGSWKAVNRENISDFSAVSYFFGKEIHQKYDIPIGLINSALGGSPVQSWLSEDALAKYPEYLAEVERLSPEGVIDSLENLDQERIRNWYADVNSRDLGLKSNWKSKEIDDSSWQSMQVPSFWNESVLGDINGIVWFRKSFELDESYSQKEAGLLLGNIVDADSVFVNGEFVGNTTYKYPPRRYTIPRGILKAGENTISIKILNERGPGGFITDKPYELRFGDDSSLDLKGKWKYRLGAKAETLQPQTFYRWKPQGLYNAMIHPLLNYSIKGVIWYQGESNTGEPGKYKAMFSDMINDWREKWDQEPENFPFLFVQLANFMESQDEPTDSNWARLREAQMKSLEVPATGMAVAIDIGEWNDIHPLNKKDVGERLALAAYKVAYGEDVIPGGPIMESYQIKGDSVVINFKNIGSGLQIRNGSILKEFAIAGADKNFVWADAQIVGDKIIVHSSEVENPVAVRYAWADNPDEANLYNKEGLPASPFRTDDWE
ncbi:beta galactosidase jelly roll domain-containing protein [Gramella sp. GC03-9]|uniref:Beta galactosidase jelly roll domain-containing protein n=1 Tax=Christiangramia oceanisediminis TaxID=2920386 RepID=A0A9X2KW95_9FLAO|nr:sialate O-acetylesterase [Gramella oceanisediminis]MCP9199064.1 beta galactosidase jelly roll domain-containing protein [Gramella oceanisediminis]